MKVDDSANSCDLSFPTTQKKTSPTVFIITLPVCAPGCEKRKEGKTVFLADAALIPDSDTCKV